MRRPARLPGGPCGSVEALHVVGAAAHARTWLQAARRRLRRGCGRLVGRAAREELPRSWGYTVTDKEEVMGDGQASDLQQLSVKDKVALTRKRENTKQMKLENSKKQKVKEPNQKHRGTRGEDQCLKEESTFSTWKATPSQDSLVIRSALTAAPLRTSNHGEPAKAGGQVPRPRGGAGDGTKPAAPPGTLGEGEGTRGDTHQGEDVEKVKSKQKKSKGRKSEEKRPEGLEEECAWRRGRRTKASTPGKSCGDRRGAHGDAGHRKTRPGERRGGLGAREERAPGGDKKTGAENPEEAQAVAEPATAGRRKRAGASRADVVRASVQVHDGDEEEGKDTRVEKIKKEENEKLGGDTQVGLVTRSNKSKSKAVVSRKDQKRKPDTAGGQGAGEAKAGRLRETELDSRSQPEHVEGHAAAKEEGVLTAGPPKKKTRGERKVKAEKSRCGVEQGRGREEEAREPEGAGLAGGREDERDDAAKGRKEGDVGRWRWWEEEKSQDGVKWRQLEHRGPYFVPSYEPLPEGVRFYYDGKPVKLSLAAEEVATFYAKMLDHEYTTKEVFQNNFFSDWRKEMTAEERKMIKHMDKCDFTEIHRHFVDKAAARKALPKEERQKLKEEAERLQQEFGYCTLDGHREKIGNFKTEPPGLFRGRGDHPKMGMLKRRVMPEDVTINCSRDSKIPEPPAGHHWKEVRCDDTVTWLASWTDNVQNSIKYIMLNPSSKLKGEKDWQKYEVARRLKGVVGEIRSQYQADWKSREMKKRQRAVALYFIDKLALRAGNEKEEGESADTVGCCSLRVEHVRLHPEADGGQHVVELDFLGKDSVRYYNRVPVEKPVYRNLRLFMRNKDPGDGLFDRLTTTSLNKHLQHLMDGLTAKVFRTYNASITLQEQLRALTRAEDSVAAKVLSYNRANRAVAVLCNHQRATPKTFEKSMRNLQLKIEAKQQQVADAKEELRKARADPKSRGDRGDSSFLKRERLLRRLEGQLVTLSTQATDKEESKQVALGTSKLNYLDPRISVAWCKRFGVPVEKIYNRAQREKFAWALDTAGEDFEF